jgi:hypothetical protein
MWKAQPTYTPINAIMAMLTTRPKKKIKGDALGWTWRDFTRGGSRKISYNSAKNFVIIKGVHLPIVSLKQQNVQQSALQLQKSCIPKLLSFCSQTDSIFKVFFKWMTSSQFPF